MNLFDTSNIINTNELMTLDDAARKFGDITLKSGTGMQPIVVMGVKPFMKLADKACRPPISPEKIFYKDKYTTVLWSDNTSTTVCCGESETFDKYSGFCAALAKKMFGSTTHVKSMIERLDVEENKRKAAENKAKEKEEARKAEEARVERARKRRIERGVKKEIERWTIEQAADEAILKIMRDRRNAEDAEEIVNEMPDETCNDVCENCQCCDEVRTEADNG